MSLIKIGEIKRPCSHPEHYAPGMIVLPPGVYQHTCPSCENTYTFTVHGGPYMSYKDTPLSGAAWYGNFNNLGV